MTKEFPSILLFPAILFIVYCGIFSYSHLLGVDIMEARNFVTAREMIENDDWLVPTMNGELRLAKPPLPTWLTALAMRMAGSDANLIANRLPAGLAAVLLLFFLYRFMLLYGASKQASIAAVLVLATSYMFMYMSRRGTWDMISHTFVMGTIWSLYQAINGSKAQKSCFVAAGMFAGLSFMSKGPVSLYTLLLPFLMSEFIHGDFRKYLQHWKMLTLSFVIALLVGSAWPAYLHFTVPEEITKIAMTEINSWSIRHVKSILWYLQFPAATGIWVFFALPALWLPHSRRVTEEHFPTSKIITWVILCFIFLTVIPEKKDRYLLPMTIPLAALLGAYITALINRCGNIDRPPLILRLYNFLSATCLLVAIAAGLYYFSSGGFDLYIVFISVAGLTMLIKLSKILLKGQQPDLIYITLSFVLLTQVAGPLASRQIGPDNFMIFQKLRNSPGLSAYKIYSDRFDIKVVWAAGKRVYQWNPDAPPDLPENEKILLLIEAGEQTIALASANKGYLMQPDHEITSESWNLFIVSRNSESKTPGQ